MIDSLCIAIGDPWGATLAVRQVGAGERIEVETKPVKMAPLLKAAGNSSAIIRWRIRDFPPFNPAAPHKCDGSGRG